MHCAVNVGADGDSVDLLRPVGHRQDDPLGRSGAQSHRRRRARLGRRPASSTSRAAATPRRSASPRCTSRTSSRRRAASGRSSRTSTSTRRRASSTSTPIGSPRTPAAPTRSTSSATPTRPGIAGQPRNVVFLTADAFGVLPPISRLTREQAAYHFISGYTAKLAGTEVGVKEPKATFSTCFGAPFMPRHPGEYAAMLVERLERWDVPVWLVNTGWTGGPYGTGERMNIAHTRSMVRAALERRARRRPDADGPELRRRGPGHLPGRARRVPGPALDLGRRRRLRPAPPSAWRRCSSRTSRRTPRASIRPSPLRAPSRTTDPRLRRRIADPTCRRSATATVPRSPRHGTQQGHRHRRRQRRGHDRAADRRGRPGRRRPGRHRRGPAPGQGPRPGRGRAGRRARRADHRHERLRGHGRPPTSSS